MDPRLTPITDNHLSSSITGATTLIIGAMASCF
jgi:hypothetical protein